jgi:MtrB/PioB family decaheme-associated outer membrane protein
MVTILAACTAIAGTLSSALVRAEDVPRPDTSKWDCEMCPFPKGHVGDYDAGATYVSDDAARFGNATGYDEEGEYLLAEGDGRFDSDAQRLRWELDDLGLDSRSITVEGGNPGTYDYWLGYSELPYRRYDTSQTIFREASDELLTLPAGWVPAGTTSGFTALNASLVDRDIESDRQSFNVGGAYRGIEDLRLHADFRRTEREGWGIVGGPFFNSTALLAAPFEDRTDTASFGATYSRENWSATLSWLGSFYDNSNDELRWENPYLGGGQGARAQAPSNDAQTVALEGVYRLPAQTVLSGSVAIGEVRQDAAFLPYTINPAVPVRDLPRGDLDGKIDTTHFDVGITSRPWSFLRLRAVYRYDDRDNRTPVAQWTRTITDLFDSGEAESNRPYSFQRSLLELSAAARFTQWWDWLKSLEFEGGFERIETERTLQETPGENTQGGWGRVRWRPNSGTELTLKAGAQRRHPNDYDLDVAQAYEQNPLLRKYHIAYRYRDYAQLDGRYNWPGQPISIGGQVFYAADSYTESPMGLDKNDDLRFAADVTWAINDRTSVYLQGGYEEQEMTVLGSETFSNVDWTSRHEDQFQSVNAGVTYVDPEGRFDTSLSLRYAEGTGDIDVMSDFSGAGPYPEQETDLKGAELEVGYRLTQAIDVRLTLQYEDYSSADWALQGVEPATVPTVLTLGADPDNYDVFLVSVSMRYSFGRTASKPAESEPAAQ